MNKKEQILQKIIMVVKNKRTDLKFIQMDGPKQGGIKKIFRLGPADFAQYSECFI
jgi:hypothetical protein